MSLLSTILRFFKHMFTFSIFRAFVVVWLSLGGHADSATAQAPQANAGVGATPQIQSPTEVLNRVTTPFVETRSDPDNWSPQEVEAYKTETREAYQQCAALEKTPYEGEELFALATLCQTGLNWPGAYSAAFRYSRQSVPHAKEAYAILLQADAALGDPRNEASHAAELASKFPFDADVNSMLSFAVDSLEILYPKESVEVALLRQRFLLPVLRGETSILNYGLALKEAWQTLMILHLEKLTDDEHAQWLLLEETLSRCEELNCMGISPEADQYQHQFELHGKTIVDNTLQVSKKDAHSLGEVWIFIGSSVPMMRKFQRTLTSGHRPGVHRYAVRLIRHPLLTAGSRSSSSLAPGMVDLAGIDRLLTPASSPFFIVADAAHTVLFAGTGNVTWLQSAHQIDILLTNGGQK